MGIMGLNQHEQHVKCRLTGLEPLKHAPEALIRTVKALFRSTERLPTLLLVIARHDEPRKQVVLVVIGHDLEEVRGGVHGGHLAQLHRVLAQVVHHEGRQGLAIARHSSAHVMF